MAQAGGPNEADLENALETVQDFFNN